jgi:LCP family protein required for cell wall assembly
LARVPTTYYEPDGESDASSKRVTFLLLGEKDGLSDSIMLIRAGPEEIAGIGVPRDTYWKGLKLNQLYYAEGARALARAVTEITGIAIDHRIRVGMEGFAEMVRAFGTIRVDVQEEIVDPSMTYRVDGNKRMLYLPPGTHELNAPGVLAFARSRRTSSDFDRAERQLQIVQGLRRRMEEVALTNAGRLYELLRSVLEHTRSNVTFDEALDYVRRFRGVEDTRHMVLSTDNVFSSTYERLFEEDRPLADAAEMASEDLGGWILRPKQEDWDLVRWYTGEWLARGKPDVETYLSRRYPLAYAIPENPLETLQMTEQGLGFRWLDRLLAGTLWQSAAPAEL